MLNPFKIYTPVRELVEHIRENKEDYEISIDSDDGMIHCSHNGSSKWRFSISPIFVFWVWKTNSVEWTTWAEGWYLYSNLKNIAVDSTPQNTREGWKKKLGLED